MKTFLALGVFPVTLLAQPAAVKAVFDRHMAAVGAADARAVPVNLHTVTVMGLPGGQETRVEMFRSADKVLIRTTVPGAGTTETVFDGSVGWSISPQAGVRLLGRDQIAQLLQQVSTPTNPDMVADARIGGRTRIEGRDVIVVNVKHKGQTYSQYYDMETGLLAAMGKVFLGIRVDPEGLIRYEEYTRFGGVLVPTVWSVYIRKEQRLVTRVITLDHDPIDPAMFARPPEVRKLLEASRQPR